MRIKEITAVMTVNTKRKMSMALVMVSVMGMMLFIIDMAAADDKDPLMLGGDDWQPSRINNSPVKGHEEDVGSTTTISLLNGTVRVLL